MCFLFFSVTNLTDLTKNTQEFSDQQFGALVIKLKAKNMKKGLELVGMSYGKVMGHNHGCEYQHQNSKRRSEEEVEFPPKSLQFTMARIKHLS